MKNQINVTFEVLSNIPTVWDLEGECLLDLENGKACEYQSKQPDEKQGEPCTTYLDENGNIVAWYFPNRRKHIIEYM